MRFKLEWSLRAQLAVSFTALLGALLLVSFLAVYRDQRTFLYQQLDRVELELARTELASAVDDPDGDPHLHNSGGEHRAVLFMPDGRLLAHTPVLSEQQSQDLIGYARRQPAGGPHFSNWNQERALVMAAGIREYPEARLALISSRLPLETSLANTRRSLLNWGLLAGVLGTLGCWALAGWLVAPLERVAALAESVRAGTLDERLNVPSQTPEVRSLQNSLNAMLDSLQTNLQELELRAQQQRQFLLDASHELRNPLHALMGTLEVAARRPRTQEEYQEALGIALTEGSRLSLLVQDLLLLARADLERLELKSGPVELASLLEECGQAHQARAQQMDIALQVEGVNLSVLGDRSRLRQILDNLVSNALRYSPAGQTVSIAARPAANGVEISVSNGGTSLTEDQYAEIFQRFSRLDASRNRHSGGVGLGLSIARELAEAQSGQLTGHARPEGGSVFVLQLPQASGTENL
ncbi:HAMP domain-containing protein [bacterium]|nr:HAMP domain-containing protein [bacterium]